MRGQLAFLITGFIVLMVSGGSRFAIGLTLKPMAAEFDWSRSALSLAVLVFLVVSSMAMYLSGRLSDRFGLTYILAGGLFISALGIGLISAVVAPWQAFVLYGFIFALGNGLTSLVPVGVLIGRMFSGRFGLANASAVSGMGFGQLIVIGVLATIMVTSGWRPVYFWLGMINLALVPFVLLIVRKPAAPRQKTQPSMDPNAGTDFAVARRTPYFRTLTVVYVICGFQDFFVATHVVAFALDQGVDALFAGNLLAAMGLAGLIGVLLSGAWSDRSDPLWPTIACFVLRAVLFALILTIQNPVAITVFALAFGLTFWVTAPLTAVFARNAYGLKHLGAISGFITMAHHMAGGVGAFVGGLLFDLSGNYQSAFLLMFVLSVAAMALSLTLRRPPATVA